MERKTYFSEIVGLRVYLALWVAVGHGLQLSGFMKRTNPFMKILLDGHAAVVVFMIVSGFVITNLLMVKQETYPRYITRRFFRLYPAYVVCCIAGYMVAGEWATIAHTVPWGADPSWIKYSASIYELEHEVSVHFWPHAALHAVMLHGIVPDAVINRAGMTFLPAAWSISLEWQFYLVAPLVIAALRNRWQLLAAIAVSLVLLIAYRKGLLGHYDIGSSIAGATPYFLIGIASRLAHDRLATLPVSPLVASGVAVFVIAAMVKEPVAPLIWAVFYSYSLWHRGAPVTGRVFRAMTCSRPALLLGEASYSLYLVHRPLQVALAFAALSLIPITHFTLFATQLLAIVIAIPLSIAVYFLVERPGIKLGASLAKRLPGTTPAARPEPPAAVIA